jgi:hypothetical protein
MAKDCTFCQITRLFVISSGAGCFAALAVLCLINGLAVPMWIIAGFLISGAVAIWAIAAYLLGRRVATGADTLDDGAR